MNLGIVNPYRKLLVIDFNGLSTSQFEVDGLWVSARRYHEIILKLILIAVVNQIDTRINIVVLHSGERLDRGYPFCGVVSKKIVAPSRQFLQANNSCVGVRANKAHSKDTISLVRCV